MDLDNPNIVLRDKIILCGELISQLREYWQGLFVNFWNGELVAYPDLGAEYE